MTKQKQYYIQPYQVGKGKRSLALILLAELVKSLNIDPLTILFLLKVMGNDELKLIIVRREIIEERLAAAAAIEGEAGHH